MDITNNDTYCPASPMSRAFAVDRTFLMKQDQSQWPSNELILWSVVYFEQQFFVFADSYHLQVQGVAMEGGSGTFFLITVWVSWVMLVSLHWWLSTDLDRVCVILMSLW